MRQGSDPRWQEYAASLRRGFVFIKMPLSFARLLTVALHRCANASEEGELKEQVLALRDFLYGELLASGELSKKVPQHCLFYRQPVAETRQEAKTLRDATSQDRTGFLNQFATVLERGAKGDSDLDWISRVGGPGPDSSFEGFARTGEPTMETDLAELFDSL